MKKINPSTYKNVSKNKTKNLSKILNSDLFFESSGMIKMALNKNRLLDRDFGIKRAKPKIDIGKKNKSISPTIKHFSKRLKEEENDNNNINNFFQKKEIPFELADIIENNKTKFKKVFDSFHDLKSKNDEFTTHWQFVQKSVEKLKKKKKEDIVEVHDKKNEEFFKNLKKYEFSNRDKIEMELQKKLSENVFKSNPLMIKNNNDMLFYYLYEYKNKFINFKEQNPTKYLNKMKELLDFAEIYVDYKKDKANKDITTQNERFLMKRQQKIDEENMKLNEEKEKQNIIDNEISKKMIKQTKRTIKLLNKNKNYFEDKKYFSCNINNNMSTTFYKNSISKSKFLTPNKNCLKMSKSSSNFHFRDQSQFKFNNTLKLLQQRRLNLSKQLSSIIDNKNKIQKIKIENFPKKNYSLEDNTNINPLIKNSNEPNSKDSIILTNSGRNNNKNILTHLKEFHKSNSLNMNNETFHNKFNQNSSNLPAIKKFPFQQTNSGEGRGVPSSKNFSNFLPQKEKENSSNLTSSKNNNDSNRSSLKKSLVNDLVSTNKKENIKRQSRNSKLMDENIKKVVVSDLYDKLKDGKDINKNTLKHIYKYIYHKKLKKKNKKDTINLIKDVQLLSDGFDINKVTKSIEDIPSKEIKQIKQIKNFKNINNELNILDKRYVKEICEFKARNQRNEGQE